MKHWFNPDRQIQMREYFKDKASLGQPIELNKGEVFTADTEFFYIIETGVFDEILLFTDGKEINLFRLEWGTLYAEMEFVQQQSIPTHLKCVESGRLRAFNRKLMSPLDKGELTDELLQSVIRKYRIILAELANNRFNNLSGRLAHLIIRLAVSSNQMESTDELEGAMIPHVYTHQDLANRLNADRSSVSALMSQFQKEGIIEIDQRRITIKNIKKLRNLTKFSVV